MVVQVLLPQDTTTWQLVNSYDNIICVIFLIDFAMHMMHAKTKRDDFSGERGYLDLLGSIPSFGFTQFVVLLPVFRLGRLIGALAGILASILVPQPKEQEEQAQPAAPSPNGIEHELAEVKSELDDQPHLSKTRGCPFLPGQPLLLEYARAAQLGSETHPHYFTLKVEKGLPLQPYALHAFTFQ
jgi:hypothetical protein